MKELVEHIRTVHLTMLAIVLIMTAALQLQREPVIERAADDAEAILRIAERWQEIPAVMDKEIAKSYNERIAGISSNQAFTPLVDDRLTVPGDYLVHVAVTEHDPELRELLKSFAGDEDDKSSPILAQSSEPLPLTISFVVRSNWVIFRRSGALGTRITQLPRLLNLKDFIQFWEDVRTQNIVVFPLQLRPDPATNGCHQLLADPDNATHYGKEPSFDARYGAGGQWTLTPSISQELVKSFEKAKTIGGHTESSLTRIEHTYSCSFRSYGRAPVPLHLGRMLTPLTFQAAHWGEGSSSEEFTALLSSAKFLEETPLRSLALSLRQRATANTETIELFQAKIPASAIPTFGSLVLIMCMFYLYAQLQELKRLVGFATNEPPPGYIGLYSGPLVVCFTIFSLILFPCVPLAIVAFRNSGMLRGLSIASMIGVFVLGIISCRALSISRRLLRERPPVPGIESGNKD